MGEARGRFSGRAKPELRLDTSCKSAVSLVPEGSTPGYWLLLRPAGLPFAWIDAGAIRRSALTPMRSCALLHQA